MIISYTAKLNTNYSPTVSYANINNLSLTATISGPWEVKCYLNVYIEPSKGANCSIAIDGYTLLDYVKGIVMSGGTAIVSEYSLTTELYLKKGQIVSAHAKYDTGAGSIIQIGSGRGSHIEIQYKG